MVLGKPPAPALTPHHANPDSSQLHYLGGLYGRQRGTIRSPSLKGDLMDLSDQGWTCPAVRSSGGCLSYREQPFSKMMPFLGQPACDDWMRWHLKIWTFWLNEGRWWKKSFSRVLCRVGRAFSGLPQRLIPSSVYSVSSPVYSHMLIPNKHLAPQTWPGSCFWRTQSVTTMELSDDREVILMMMMMWLLYSGFLLTSQFPYTERTIPR